MLRPNWKEAVMVLSRHTGTVRELVPLLFVQDIERSLAFYRDSLGFEVRGKWEPDGKLSWCRIERGHSALMLQQALEEDGPAEGRGRGVGFFFVCDDADAVHSEFRSRGLQLNAPEVAFYGMKQVFVKDPDGYELCFQSPTQGM
jgi:catechol 2,3-dioxygenase-like lactoylglutathione lyase family enzyme